MPVAPKMQTRRLARDWQAGSAAPLSGARLAVALKRAQDAPTMAKRIFLRVRKVHVLLLERITHQIHCAAGLLATSSGQALSTT